MRRHAPLCFFLLFCGAIRADTRNSALALQIDKVINGKDYKQAFWGILVTDAKTGEAIYELNPDKLLKPASTTKLFSTAAALATLGPDFKFETPVYRRGQMVKGRLKGDLILVASGDLTMGGRTGPDGKMRYKDHDHIYAGSFPPSAALTDTDPLAGLNDLAKQVAAEGIRNIDGEVLIDDRLFVKDRGSGSGPDLLTPIIVNDNVVDVVVTPAAKVGQPATVRMHPESAFVTMDAQVETVAAGSNTRLSVRAVSAQRFTVRGQIVVGSAPRVGIYIVDDPTGYARALFIEALRRAGVAVRASALEPPYAELPPREGYGGLTRVAVHTSAPFSEAVKVTLKVSHNLYASMLPLLVAVKKGKRTLAEGMRLQGTFLAGLGLDVNTISFGGGAGGSPADMVTPRAAVQLLQALARRPEYAVFQAGLPVLGVDGTLAEAVPADSPAKGKLRAKTGTYYWHDGMNSRALLTSKALAGTMTTARGRSLNVAIFVNRVPLPRGVTVYREGKVIGHLCELIYQHAPQSVPAPSPARSHRSHARSIVALSLSWVLTVGSAAYGAPPTIVCLGDSVTKGTRPGVEPGETFCAILEARLAKAGLQARVVNAGIGGHTAADGLARLARDVVALKPGFAVIMFGLNDSWIDDGKKESRFSATDYARHLRAIIAEVRKKHIVPILMTPNPVVSPKYPPRRNAHLKPYVSAMRALAADEKILLVDVYGAFAELGLEEGNLASFFTDGMHPNPKGHALIAAILEKEFQRLLRSDKPVRN